MRVLIDTNIWISSLLSENMGKRISRILGNPKIEIIGSQKWLLEIETVLSRPKFHGLISKETSTDFLALLLDRIDMTEATSRVVVCRDPNDDFLLAICKDGDVDFLITGDKDLLAMHSFENSKIVSIGEFIKITEHS